MGASRKEPVKYTCPNIDGIIKCIVDARRLLNDGEDGIDDAAYCLRGLESDLEDLRSANASLRDWGCELARELGEYDEEADGLKSRVSELETEVENLKDYVSELETKVRQLENELSETT